MPFAALPITSQRVKRARGSSVRSKNCMDERKKLIADYRELLGTEEERAAYDQMIESGAPRVSLRRRTQVLLRTLVHEPVLQQDPRIRRAAGTARILPGSRDVFQLRHYELEAAIVDLMTSWSNGSRAARAVGLAPVVAERRAAIARMGEAGHAARLGPVPDIIDDPAIVMLWGITRESLDNGCRPAAQRKFERDQRRGSVEWGSRRRSSRRQIASRISTACIMATSWSARSRTRAGRRYSRRSWRRCRISAAR